MQIQTVTLRTAQLSFLARFYAEVLGLPTTLAPSYLQVQVGTGLVIFQEELDFAGTYHLAFEVPNNLVDDAQAWLSERVTLLADQDGVTRFEPSGRWNTTNLYFDDPAGNLLELIARHDRPTEQNGPFTARCLLNVSEVGVVVPHVPDAVAQLEQQYGLSPFNGQSETFTAVGGHDGMLIVVPAGRGWFPVQRPAVIAPIRLSFSSTGQSDQVVLSI